MNGPILRHFIGVLVGALFTWLLNLLPWITTYISAEQLVGVQEWAIGTLTLQGGTVLIAIYAATEKFLKRFRAIDPDGFTEREMIRAAAIQRGHMRA